MQELLRLLAGWKGIVVEPGAELRLELAGFPSGGRALLLLLLAVGALVLVLSVYRKDAGGLTSGRRLLLAALRTIAVLSALLLVLEPNIVAVKKEVRPGNTILLIDVSQSMNHKDAFRRPEVQDRAQAWRALGISDPINATRLDLAKALLSKGDQELVEELGKKNKVLVYGIAAASEPVPVLAVPAKQHQNRELPPPPKLDLAALSAEGRQSNLGGAIRSALEKSRDSAIAGVIVLSDGRRTMGPQGAEVARLLSQRKIPHTLVLPIGDASETQSVEVSRLDAPDKVFQKDPFRIRAHLATQGYEQAPVTMRLVTVSSGPTGTPPVTALVQQKAVQIGGNQPDLLVEFEEITADKPGILTYRVEIDPPSGEAVSPERHTKSVQLEVLAEQTKVLLIAGSPTYEYRTLVNFLVRDKTVDVSCWLQSADPNFPQDGDTQIKALPIEKKELAAYDVFLLLDPDSKRLPKEWCELVAKLVQEDGAGLWWVAGEKHSLDALRDTSPTKSLAELLPVVPDLKLADTTQGMGIALSTAWGFELTPEGEAHPAARILNGRDENKLFWPRLPGHYWSFPVLKAKPAAAVLLGHTSPKLKRADGPMPLFASQFLGAGRVLYSGFDESYRWRSIYEEAYQKHWIKGIRFLFEGRIAAGNTRFKIRLSADKCELGEPMKITVEAQDEMFRPLGTASVDVRLVREGGSQETLRLTAVAEAPGRFELLWQPPASGFYRFGQTQKAGKDVETTLQVTPAAIEKEGPVDLQELGAIASAPGGKLLSTPQELLDAAARIPSLTATDVFKTPHAIWDSWATVVWVLFWLALEWVLRKRSNLL